MEKLITVKDVCQRYGCTLPTARKYIRECNPHMERPLTAPEWAFREWENKRTVVIGSKRHIAEVMSKMSTGRIIVPRRRKTNG